MAARPVWGTECRVGGLVATRVVEAVVLGGGSGGRAREGAGEGMGLATQGEGTSWVTQRTLQSHCSHPTYGPESEEDLAP